MRFKILSAAFLMGVSTTALLAQGPATTPLSCKNKDDTFCQGALAMYNATVASPPGNVTSSLLKPICSPGPSPFISDMGATLAPTGALTYAYTQCQSNPNFNAKCSHILSGYNNFNTDYQNYMSVTTMDLPWVCKLMQNLLQSQNPSLSQLSSQDLQRLQTRFSDLVQRLNTMNKSFQSFDVFPPPPPTSLSCTDTSDSFCQSVATLYNAIMAATPTKTQPNPPNTTVSSSLIGPACSGTPSSLSAAANVLVDKSQATDSYKRCQHKNSPDCPSIISSYNNLTTAYYSYEAGLAVWSSLCKGFLNGHLPPQVPSYFFSPMQGGFVDQVNLLNAIDSALQLFPHRNPVPPATPAPSAPAVSQKGTTPPVPSAPAPAPSVPVAPQKGAVPSKK